MEIRFKRFISISALSVLAISGLSNSAQASTLPSWVSTHKYTYSVTETGSGAQREITYTLNATIGNPIFPLFSGISGNQLELLSSQLILCPTSVTTAEPILLSQSTPALIPGCQSVGTTDTVDLNTADGTTSYTRTLTLRGAALTAYDTLIQTLPQPVWWFGVGDGVNGVAFYSLGQDTGDADNQGSGEDNAEQPVVQFAGPLLSRIERLIVDGTGSVTVYGKRLFTATSATVGGIEVTLTKASKTDKSMVVSFEDLPSGSHDLVLHTTNGKITLRSAVVIK